MNHPLYYFAFLLAVIWLSLILTGYIFAMYRNSTVLKYNPKPFVLQGTELIVTVITIAYLITYIKYH